MKEIMKKKAFEIKKDNKTIRTKVKKYIISIQKKITETVLE